MPKAQRHSPLRWMTRCSTFTAVGSYGPQRFGADEPSWPASLLLTCLGGSLGRDASKMPCPSRVRKCAADLFGVRSASAERTDTDSLDDVSTVDGRFA